MQKAYANATLFHLIKHDISEISELHSFIRWTCTIGLSQLCSSWAVLDFKTWWKAEQEQAYYRLSWYKLIKLHYVWGFSCQRLTLLATLSLAISYGCCGIKTIHARGAENFSHSGFHQKSIWSKQVCHSCVLELWSDWTGWVKNLTLDYGHIHQYRP